MLSIACTNEEKVTVTAAPVTASGRPAAVDGPLRVTVQSGDGTFEQDPAKPLSFKAVSGEALADTVYLVEADADLTGEVELIQDTVTLTVSGAKAKNFGLTAGPTEPKTVAP